MAERLSAVISRLRQRRRLGKLRDRGMYIADDVVLPASTLIDTSHASLIHIESGCVLGENCLILAHDAQMDEFLDIARIGRVIVHADCYIGHRSVILCGLEIGPRTIVAPNSVVSKALPPDTFCAGSPARPVCTLDELLAERVADLERRPTFPLAKFGGTALDAKRRAQLVDATADGAAYLVTSSE